MVVCFDLVLLLFRCFVLCGQQPAEDQIFCYQETHESRDGRQEVEVETSSVVHYGHHGERCCRWNLHRDRGQDAALRYVI